MGIGSLAKEMVKILADYPESLYWLAAHFELYHFIEKEKSSQY